MPFLTASLDDDLSGRLVNSPGIYSPQDGVHNLGIITQDAQEYLLNRQAVGSITLGLDARMSSD